MNPSKLLATLAGLKLTRYGLVFGSGIICGSWAAIQWPEQTAAFWAMPSTSLGLAIAGLWLSQRKTKANERAKACAVADALYTAPEGMILVSAEAKLGDPEK